MALDKTKLKAYYNALQLHKFDLARQMAQESLQVGEVQQDDWGRANALQALGNLDRRLGRVGLAYTWAELARLSSPVDAVMAEKAKAYAGQSGLPPVIQDIASLLETPTSTI